MVASRCGFSALLVGLFATALGQAEERAELTFLLTSRNLLGDAPPSAPPWETLEGFRTGRDTRARLALGTEQAGAFHGLRTSALLRLDLALASAGQESALMLRDASSWLAVTLRAGRDLELRLRAYPLDTDYVRLGYAHALDWGGTDVARRESVFLRQEGGVPGAELALSSSRVRLFSWLKSAQVPDDVRGPKRVWGGAVGGSFSPSSGWRIDAGLGFFQRPPTFLEGASLRVVWHRRISEPELAAEPFRPAPFHADPDRFVANAGSGFAVALEGVALVSRQRRYEDPSLATTTLAPAGALYGSLRASRWAGHFLISWRSLPFLLKSDPRVLPEQALPAAAPSVPELGAWLGGSVELWEHRLVPSVELGARLPAAVVSSAGTFIASGPAGLDALPLGRARGPVLAARFALRLQASSALSLVLATEYQSDSNRSAISTSPLGVMRHPTPSHGLSQLLAAQARF